MYTTRAELQRLQAETSAAKEGGKSISSSSTHKSPYTKIVGENDRLRKDLRREVERNEQLQLSLSTLEVQNIKLQEELNEVIHL